MWVSNPNDPVNRNRAFYGKCVTVGTGIGTIIGLVLTIYWIVKAM